MSNGSVPRPHARTSTPNGLARTPSTRSSTPVSARAAARKPRANSVVANAPKANTSQADEEAREQQAAIIADLKEQLQKAENVSEKYSKQLDVLQMRLDEAVSEQGRLEDHSHEKDLRLEQLDAKIIENVRQIRDLEQAHEKERNAMLQEKEQQASREEEMQATIQRLKEYAAQKDAKANSSGSSRNLSRSCKFDMYSGCFLLFFFFFFFGSSTNGPL